MTDHDRLGELAGPYALGALGEDDRRAFEAHMATCAECRREVRDAAMVAEGLGRAVDPQEPPAGLRDRVLAAAVASAKQEPRLGRHPVDVMAVAGGVARRRRVRLVCLDAADEAAHDGCGPAIRAGGARGARVATDAVAARSPTKRRGRRTCCSHRTSSSSTSPARRPRRRPPGRAFYSPSRGLVFTANGLPPLPAGLVYQLWLVTGLRSARA